MAADADLESSIDHLYQLPLDEFVARRNALARETGGPRAAAVRALQKPNVIAWALNQFYWTARDKFDLLVAAAARLRKAQADALLGRPNDLRAADAEHRKEVREALKATTAILDGAGHAGTPDAVRVISAALEALPWKEGPGRLVRPPAPAGFEALAGLQLASMPPERTHSAAGTRATRAPRRPEDADATESRPSDARADAVASRRALEEALEAARATVAAAKRVEADETSKARKSEERLDQARASERAAREALEEAQRAVRERDADHRQAVRARETAADAVRDAERKLAALERRS